MSGVLLRLGAPPCFSLSRAVCSYGLYMTAPNSWTPLPRAACGGSSNDGAHVVGVLERPLRLRDGRAVMASVWEEGKAELVVWVKGVDKLEQKDSLGILMQVKRMLRISDEEDEMLDGFHAVHSKAKAEGFGRLFRSPTLFEDMIKSLLLCNCGWSRTLKMSRALCELQYELKGPPLGHSNNAERLEEVASCLHVSEDTPPPMQGDKRKSVITRSTSSSRANQLQKRFSQRIEEAARSSKEEAVIKDEFVEEESSSPAQIGMHGDGSESEPQLGGFPTAEELSDLDPAFLAKRCSLGYRVKWVLKLAKDVSSGALQLSKFEGPSSLKGEELRAALLELDGFGPFSSANVMMLLGNYSVVPADTETIRHLKHFHGKQDVHKKNVFSVVASIYAKYTPFEFLAYWWELWRSYEQRFGCLSRMAASDFHQITGSNMRKFVRST